MLDDNEISVASEDAGDAEVAEEDDAEGEEAAQKKNVVKGAKGKGVIMGMMEMTMCDHILRCKPKVVIVS